MKRYHLSAHLLRQQVSHVPALHNQIKPNSTSTSDLPSDPMASGPTKEHAGVKRKRTYSHCYQEGHNKSKKKGKITCPQLL